MRGIVSRDGQMSDKPKQSPTRLRGGSARPRSVPLDLSEFRPSGVSGFGLAMRTSLRTVTERMQSVLWHAAGNVVNPHR